jgi:hypothetical protein
MLLAKMDLGPLDAFYDSSVYSVLTFGMTLNLHAPPGLTGTPLETEPLQHASTSWPCPSVYEGVWLYVLCVSLIDFFFLQY